MASKKKKSSKQNKSNTSSSPAFWFYFLAILPVPLLFIASQFLRTTISSPPSDYGSGSMFDLIATRYDFINRVLALNLDMSWRHRLVKEVVGAEGEIFTNENNNGESIKFLDLATGTADVAILLGKSAAHYTKELPKASSPTVLGLDPSQNMLNIAETKIKHAALSNIVSLQLGDSRRLDSIEDNTFNAATMSFGIRNVPEKEMALCEIHRVLKKGSKSASIESKLAIMEFSEPGPDTGIMGAIARQFIRHLVPAMGAVLSGYPREYMHLQKSIKDFPSPTEFVALMEGLKCPIKGGDGEELEIDTFGSFRVKEMINLMFGSVQIYVANPILKQYVTE